jgi:hypothetical protein
MPGRVGIAGQAATPNASAFLMAVYHATEYQFDGPMELTAGWNRLTLLNDGTMPHHLMLLRLNDGKMLDDLLAALPQGLEGVFAVSTSMGGPGSVEPGQHSTVVLDLHTGNVNV